MILSCPACATRYEVDGTKFPAQGRTVRCAKCGHSWHQPGPEPEVFAPEPASAPAPTPAEIVAVPAAEPEKTEQAWTEPSSNSGGARPRAPVAAPAGPPKPRMAFLPMLGVALGWVSLIAVVLLIGLSAVRYRQEITVIWPQSAGVYSRLGMPVKTDGIDFTDVTYRRESEDGQVVLAVTGQIVNHGTRELPVPQAVRVTLSDGANKELYHWNFTPEAQTLKPGQSAPFLTRLSSPPAAARHLEVRFDKDGPEAAKADAAKPEGKAPESKE
jgi:predicted Zn finger-like uncharacterized protein